MNMLEFCEHLYNDIKDNLNEWIDWFCDETDLDKREIELNKKLDRLKKLIDKQRKYFLDNCCFL